MYLYYQGSYKPIREVAARLLGREVHQYPSAETEYFWRQICQDARTRGTLIYSYAESLDDVRLLGYEFYSCMPNCGKRTLNEISKLIGGWTNIYDADEYVNDPRLQPLKAALRNKKPPEWDLFSYILYTIDLADKKAGIIRVKSSEISDLEVVSAAESSPALSDPQ